MVTEPKKGAVLARIKPNITNATTKAKFYQPISRENLAIYFHLEIIARFQAQIPTHGGWTKYPQFINWMATRLRVSLKISPLQLSGVSHTLQIKCSVKHQFCITQTRPDTCSWLSLLPWVTPCTSSSVIQPCGLVQAAPFHPCHHDQRFNHPLQQPESTHSSHTLHQHISQLRALMKGKSSRFPVVRKGCISLG